MNHQRTERLGADIQAALGEMLSRGEIKDPRVRNTPLITITWVRVTGDLREACAGFTAFGADEPSRERVCQGLNAARSFVQQALARRLRTRNTPLLTFEIDRSLDQAFHVDKILREIKSSATPQASSDAVGEGAGASDDENGDDDVSGDTTNE